MNDPSATKVGLLLTARAMVQVIERSDAPVEDQITWTIDPITVNTTPGPQAGLFADLYAAGPSGVECQISAVLGVEGWPAPASGEEYDQGERAEIVASLAPHYRHALWDYVATLARVQLGLVQGTLHIPSVTPDHKPHVE